MSNTKSINKYSVQYWLYAILNKKYGKTLNIKRSPLHARYAVNKHSFLVSGIMSKNVMSYLDNYLQASGFTLDNKYQSLPSYTKIFNNKQVYINMFACGNENVLDISCNVYQF